LGKETPAQNILDEENQVKHNEEEELKLPEKTMIDENTRNFSINDNSNLLLISDPRSQAQRN